MRILFLLLFLIFANNANAQTCIGAAPLTQTIIDNTIDICLPTTNAQEISALALRETLKTMAAATFQNGNVSTISGSGTLTGLSCSATYLGLMTLVSNGVASPSLGATVSTTGTTFQKVWCNGTNWVYG